MRRAAFCIGLALAISAIGSAMAAPIPIKGSFGDKEGCGYARTGNPSTADVFFLLTKDSVTTAASACDFGKLVSSARDRIVVKVTCQSEDDTADDVATITSSGADAYTVSMTDGTKWGPLKRCR